MAKNTHHVVPDPNGGWSVKRGGAVRASKHFETKRAAEAWGRDVSLREGSDLVIHRRDGTVDGVQRKSSFRGEPLTAQR